MDRLIKVFGERNTATRAVIRMIDAAPGIQGVAHEGVADETLEPYNDMIRQVEEVYKGPWKRVYREAIKDIRGETLGPLGAWKHGAPLYNAAYREFDVGVIFMVRNPYSWITSLHRRPYHNMGRRNGTLTEFVSFPWMTVGRDNVDKILPSPMLLWPLKLRAYETFKKAAYEDGVPCTWIRFEDFVQFPVKCLTDALKALALPPEGLRALTRPTKPYGKLPEERRSYYGKEVWRGALCCHSVKKINDLIDWSLAESHGYARLDPADFPDKPILEGKRRPAAAARHRIRVVDNEARADDFRYVVNGGI